MQPDLILIPFGKNATAGTIEPIPDTAGPGDGPQKATWNYGFPQVTMTPLAAGGIPPQGQDINGVLKAISEHTVFTGHGGQYKWSSAYVTASGGYSIGDVIQADDGLNSYVSLVNTNTANFNTTPASIGVSWALYAGRKTQDQATETLSGIAEIATQAEVTTGADDARFITPAKLRGAQATQAEAEAGTDNTKLMTPLRTRQLVNKAVSGIVGGARNLKMLIAAASASATLTADEIIVETSLGGTRYCLPGFNKTINLASVGAGGMDVGAAPASGWVAIYAIYNPTTGVSALLATNATSAVAPEIYGGANMPAGYTASALVSVWGITAGGLLQIGKQFGRDLSVALTTVLNITSTQAGFTSVNISAGAPPNAKTVSVLMNSSSSVSTSLSMFASPDGVTDAQQLLSTNTTQSVGIFRDVKVITPQIIFTRFNASGTVTLLVNIAQYSI